MRTIDISQFNSPREYYAALSDNAMNATDRAVIDNADDELANQLGEEWWETHRAEFSLEFEETAPERWGEVVARKRAAMLEWVANQIRERMAATL